MLYFPHPSAHHRPSPPAHQAISSPCIWTALGVAKVLQTFSATAVFILLQNFCTTLRTRVARALASLEHTKKVNSNGCCVPGRTLFNAVTLGISDNQHKKKQENIVTAPLASTEYAYILQLMWNLVDRSVFFEGFLYCYFSQNTNLHKQ